MEKRASTTTTTKQSFRVCLCFSRRFKMRAAEPPGELRELFERYSGGKGVMSVEDVERFMAEVQGVKTKSRSRDEAQAAMDSLKDLKHLNIFQRKGLSLEAFFRFLLSDANPPLDPSLSVHHDMTAPLSHYFIYTGHNSYLTGNQISSDCSDVPIIRALHDGVRVIELDIWPNSKNDNVDVLHGRTLTPPVELIKCLRSIKENAFVASSYPLVITLEDHLKPDLQAKVAAMISETFGDMLFYPETENFEEFPSPESLKRKIIISTKPPKEYKETEMVNESSSGKDKVSNNEEAWGKEVPDIKANIDASDKNDIDVDDHQEEDGLDEMDCISQQNPAPEYKRLIAIHALKPKGKLKEALKPIPDIDIKVRRLSMNEQALEKLKKNHGTEIVRFTQRNLLRVYPKSTRVDSSNYNPLIGWMHGAQMVAFNMQGYGRSLWLMHGMFRANGGCGYVKKPDILLKVGPHNEVFDPRATLPEKKILKVTVYLGDGWYMDFRRTHFDICSPPDFYVRVGIAGVPADSVMKNTKIIEDDWSPIWDQEFQFPLTVPELALLRIEVHEHDLSGKDDFGGQTCLPVSELRTGFRSVPLHSYEGQKYKSVRLLMRYDFV